MKYTIQLKETIGYTLVVVGVLITLLTPFQVSAGDKNNVQLREQLITAIESHSPGGSINFFRLPDSDDFDAIPQDVNNPLTAAKVRLGKLLFHETGVGTATTPDRAETYSCASCHHAAAGFKAGREQGIGDGGVGFANNGARRKIGKDMNPDAADGDPDKPDFQMVTSPAALNTAYQPVMLWNGALGNSDDGINSRAINLHSAGPPEVMANSFGLSGLETQVLAGTRLHRLRFDDNSVLQTNPVYAELYKQAFADNNIQPENPTGYIPAHSVVTPQALGAAKAIAAFERTMLANQAPFQRWLRGDVNAMSRRQLRGALLFFGKAGCVDCHTGPALSSAPGAGAERIFFNVGFSDFDTSRKRIVGTVPDSVSLGRGSFTGDTQDDYKFKIPQLYNLKDTHVFGHGASLSSLRELIDYKNNAIPQQGNTRNLADEFKPLGLSRRELRDLKKFIAVGLYDPNLHRYEPDELPTGNCTPVADFKSALQLGCF